MRKEKERRGGVRRRRVDCGGKKTRTPHLGCGEKKLSVLSETPAKGKKQF